MMSLSNAELIPRGRYCVGANVFWDKITALAFAEKTNQPVHWDFNNQLFSAYDWTNEPLQDISYYYIERCKQIRDQYQYIVLHYSGGSDSNNILTHFYRSGIHIDQINVTIPLEYYEKHTRVSHSDEASELHNEWYNVIKPDLLWIEKHLPNSKITIHDSTNDIINFNVDQDWILHAGENCNPNIAGRMKYYDVVDSKIYDNKKVGHIYGVDKPRVFCHQGHWYFAFLDSVLSISSTYKPQWLKQDHVHVVNFYWSPDAALLLIKQAHLIKKHYEANQHLLRLATIHTLTEQERELQQVIIKSAVYPFWRNDIFQVKKSNSVFYKEFDQWFFHLAGNSAKNRWIEGYRHIMQQVPGSWINKDINNMPTGIKGMWSKWHNLGSASSINIKDL